MSFIFNVRGHKLQRNNVEQSSTLCRQAATRGDSHWECGQRCSHDSLPETVGYCSTEVVLLDRQGRELIRTPEGVVLQ